MVPGFIFDIKRFALHDGPGLRTTVFFKGCPLSCLGCHNPEGQGAGPELLFRPDRCTRCGDCLPACPQGALSLAEEGIRVDRSRCRLTGACEEACLPGALEVAGRAMWPGEVLDELERDRIYYDESGGGATFSGGEPLAQPAFLRALLEGCRDREIRVALDTCGHAPPGEFRALAPLASLLLFDLKLLHEARHEAFTGVSNRWILENLRWAGEAGLGLTVRIPLIPGVNDDEENLHATGAFLGSLPRALAVDLLPYHRLGVEKYPRLGRRYRLPEVETPGRDEIAPAVRTLEASGLQVTVRGEAYGHD